MSEGIAPLPNGMGVSVVAQHRPRPDREPREERDGQSRNDEHDPAAPDPEQRQHPHDPVAAPSLDDIGLPAGTLFTMALIANELPLAPPSSDELKLRAAHGWMPPDSPLRLKDKLI